MQKNRWLFVSFYSLKHKFFITKEILSRNLLKKKALSSTPLLALLLSLDIEKLTNLLSVINSLDFPSPKAL